MDFKGLALSEKIRRIADVAMMALAGFTVFYCTSATRNITEQVESHRAELETRKLFMRKTEDDIANLQKLVAAMYEDKHKPSIADVMEALRRIEAKVSE